MDSVDRRLIDALRADGRASYAELSRIVGLSSSSVHERVAKLEASGVIQGYRAVVDPIQVGFGVTALVGIEPGETGDDEVIAAGLDAMPEVESSYSVAGNEAFIVKVRVADIDALHRCLGRLRAIRGVARTRTTVVLATRYEMRPHLLEPAVPDPTTGVPDGTADAAVDTASDAAVDTAVDAADDAADAAAADGQAQ